MVVEQMQALVASITYKPGWELKLKHDGSRPYLQVHVANGIDSLTGEPVAWVSGKRWLSEFMTAQEIVGSAFALIKDAELHEVHEFFRYKGASIYNPHINPDVLVEVARKASSFEVRQDSMTRA